MSKDISVRLDLSELRCYNPTDDTIVPWDKDEPYVVWSVAKPGVAQATVSKKSVGKNIGSDDWAVHDEHGAESVVVLVEPTTLKPGQRVSVVIAFMEEDDGAGPSKFGVLGKAALAALTGGLGAIDGILVGGVAAEIAHQINKGGDDLLGMIAFTLENRDGVLVKKMKVGEHVKHTDPTATRKRFSESNRTIRVVSDFKANAGLAGIRYHAGFIVRDGGSLESLPWTQGDSPAP